MKVAIAALRRVVCGEKFPGSDHVSGSPGYFRDYNRWKRTSIVNAAVGADRKCPTCGETVLPNNRWSLFFRVRLLEKKHPLEPLFPKRPIVGCCRGCATTLMKSVTSNEDWRIIGRKRLV